MDTVARTSNSMTSRRWWSALLFVTLGVVMVGAMMRMRDPIRAAAATEPFQELGEPKQELPAAASGKWLRLTTNLSGASNLLSAYPDVAVSDNGQYVAVVWQEQAPGDPEKAGYIYIRCAQEGSTQGWGAKRAVPDSYGSNLRGLTPAVALYGNRVHVVWAGGYDEYDKIYYRAGTVKADNSVAWDPRQTVFDGSGETLSIPDIDVDSSGQPHVVWQQKDATGKKTIYYSSQWGTRTRVSKDSDTLNQDPAVAVEGTTAHVTWVGGTITGTVSIAGSVYYANSGNWSNRATVAPISTLQPQRPSIATSYDSAKDVTWVGISWESWDDKFPTEEVDNNDLWYLDYRYTTNGGVDWSERDDYRLGSSFHPHYVGGDEYVRAVRPSLVYDNVQTPHIALARTAGGGVSGTMITYRYQLEGTTWTFDIMPLGSSTYAERGAARAAIGHYGGEDHLHFVYQLMVGKVGDESRWDVFYASDEVYSTARLPLIQRDAP